MSRKGFRLTRVSHNDGAFSSLAYSQPALIATDVLNVSATDENNRTQRFAVPVTLLDGAP